MPKTKPIRRAPGILAGFDKAKLRQHAEAADQQRAPTQEELAQAYNADAEIVGIAVQYPASIEEIVEGICAQDQRFLDSGRRLLERLLRKAAASAATDKSTRRRRAVRANSSSADDAYGSRTGAGAEAASAGARSHDSDAASVADSGSASAASLPDMFADDYSGAEMYGG